MKLGSTFARCFVLPIIFASTTAVRADVLAHWSFDELTGADHDTFVDSADGSIKHNALVADKGQVSINVAADVPFGKAVTFNGKTGSYLDVPEISGMRDHSFTVAVWVWINANEHNYVLADWSANSFAYAFGIDVPARGAPTASRINGMMRSGVVRNAKKDPKLKWDIVKFQPNNPVSTSSWHHIAWVWDRTDDQSGMLTEYLDGATIGGSMQVAKTPTTKILETHRGPKIGLKADTLNTFHGSMDELWVFNDALTPDQVMRLMKTNDIAGTVQVAAATTPPVPASADPVPAATLATSANPSAAPASPSPSAIATAVPSVPAASPKPTATPAAPVPAPTATPDFLSSPAAPPTVARSPSPAPIPTPAPAPAETAKPDFMQPAPVVSARPLAPLVPALAVAPRHYTPERLLGLVGTGSLALTLSGFLFWATKERSRMRPPRSY